MKGVILGINPQAGVVDLSHQISPQSVREGAYVLGTTYRYFPRGTIHLAVVDPGVGTERRGLLVRGTEHYFIGPDNGIFSHVLADALDRAQEAPGRLPGSSRDLRPCQLPSGWQAVSLTQGRYWLPKVNATFHGRDIFAPVAAHLSLGVPMDKLGEPISSVMVFPRFSPARLDEGGIQGEVIYIDRFGDLITNITASWVPRGRIEIRVSGCKVQGISKTYDNAEGLLALFGSAGYLEIAQRRGSAAAVTGAKVGTEVVIRRLGRRAANAPPT